MKKIITIGAIILGVIVLLLLNFYPHIFGNKEYGDFKQKYDYAIVQRFDGEQKIEISSWRDYEGEQIQITDFSGNVYLVSSYNTILVREGE